MPPKLAPADAARLLEEQLPTIERIVAAVCRRKGLQGDDADDFRSWVVERLVEGEYAILRKFRGGSSLSTYLVVVVNNLFRDHVVKLRGKWRPSAAAQRLGTVAVALEELVHRRGWTLREAESELRSRGVWDGTGRALAELAALLPDRPPLRPTAVPAVALETEASGARTDESLDREAWREARSTALEGLDASLADLDPEERMIVRLRYFEGLSVADVARTLGLDQKPIYRRLPRLLRSLRAALEERGVTEEMVGSLLRDPAPVEPWETVAGETGTSRSESVQSGEAR